MSSSLKRRHLAAVPLLAAATLAALPPSGPAQAAESTDTVTVNVDVGAGITIDVTTTSFTLAGLPGATAATPAAVAVRVFTNNPTGYTVSVEPTAADLTGPGGAVIPTSDLQVRDTTVGGAYAGLTPGTPVTVNTKPGPSIAAGDLYTHDYQIVIPSVPQGIYTGTLDYIATTT
jgi:hypothetical protein